MRQALFDVLGQWCEGLRVLDLFAGTGALGLEALSRGAAHATFVDSGREAQTLCKSNASALGFGDRVELCAMPAERALETLSKRGRQFDLIFVDPPYALQIGTAMLRAIEGSGVLADGARIVVEHSRDETVGCEGGRLEAVDLRRFGDTMVSIFRLTVS